MTRIKINDRLPLAEAIRRGKLEDVVHSIEKGYSGRIELSEEEFQNWSSDDDGYISAFEYALLRKRWPITIALMHAPEDYLEKGLSDTTVKRSAALLSLLSSLERNRPDKPLPAKLCKQIFSSWEEFDQSLAGQVGPGGENAQSSFRIKSVFYQPSWIRLVPVMLKAGVPANEYAVSSEGMVSSLLRVAAVRGMKQDVHTLLEAGANPLFKMHDASLAAHAAADLSRLPPDPQPGEYGGVPSLDHITARFECFQVLNAIPGVAQTVNWHGKTPEKAWQDGLAWLATRDLPSDPIRAAAYQQRKMELLTGAPTAPSVARPRM